MTDAPFHGSTDDRFQPVVDVLQTQLNDGYDLGASLAVAVDGKVVTDVWGGWVDEAKEQEWAADTITNVWSTTKTMTALSALKLIDEGHLSPTDRVADHWPEFAAAGKETIEVRHLMGHTSGVSGWEQPVTPEDILDDEKATARLAEQAPWWEPGAASGYHALNQGHLVGEVIRRADPQGRGLKQYFAEEIAGPLNADFTIGCPPKNRDRIANVIPPDPNDPTALGPIDPDSPAIKTFTGPAIGAELSWTAGWRDATIGAANGHGNARSVATIQAAVSNRGTAIGGSADGVRLLSADGVERIFDVQSNGADLVLGLPVRFGLGYAVPSALDPMSLGGRKVCFWGGWGGSIVVNDLDSRVTLAYMMNRMQSGLVGNETSVKLLFALAAILHQ